MNSYPDPSIPLLEGFSLRFEFAPTGLKLRLQHGDFEVGQETIPYATAAVAIAKILRTVGTP